jgi:hypothetical protein
VIGRLLTHRSGSHDPHSPHEGSAMAGT